MLQDLRFAVRGLRRNPGFALAAILTLGLGIGANTAIFAILNAVALQPLDYVEPDRLFRVRTRQPITLQALEAWRERVRGVDALSGYTTSSATLIASGDPLVLNCGVVSAEHVAVLGREPFLGHGFRSADHPPGADPVVVLNHGLWMRRFGGDPAILGRSIALRDERSDRKTVVGVMPPDHRALVDSWQVLVPHRIDRDDPAWHDMAGVAGSLMASRVLQGLLFEVHALDAAVLGGVAACLLVSAGVASWIPARRAAATDPLTALRQE